MKVLLLTTENWKSIEDAKKTAEQMLSPFGVSIEIKSVTFDASDPAHYDLEESLSWDKKVQTKSIKASVIRSLGILHGGADVYGLIVDKNKSLEDNNLYGQHNGNTIEVYALKRGKKLWGMDYTAYNLVHELLHAIAWKLGLKDTLHDYLTRNKTLDGYIQELASKCAILTRTNDNGAQAVGTLSCNGKTFYTLERPWKDNKTGISCIPTGIYKVKWTYSPRFLRNMYQVMDVPNRTGIRIHSGNHFFQIEGCILLGDSYADVNKDGVIDVLNSKKTIKIFEDMMLGADFPLIVR